MINDTNIGPRPGDDLNDVAEATAEALEAIHCILVLLRRDDRLTERERVAFDSHMAKVLEIAEWADPHGKRRQSLRPN